MRWRPSGSSRLSWLRTAKGAGAGGSLGPVSTGKFELMTTLMKRFGQGDGPGLLACPASSWQRCASRNLAPAASDAASAHVWPTNLGKRIWRGSGGTSSVTRWLCSPARSLLRATMPSSHARTSCRQSSETQPSVGHWPAVQDALQQPSQRFGRAGAGHPTPALPEAAPSGPQTQQKEAGPAGASPPCCWHAGRGSWTGFRTGSEHRPGPRLQGRRRRGGTSS